MSSQYTSLAQYYDIFNKSTNYKKTADYIEEIFTKYDVSPAIVLDMGCGTGNLTIELDSRNYDMIGLDSSVDMLNVAISKKRKRKTGSILWLNQDMTDFELYGSVDAVVCCFDSINYILEEEKLRKCISLVRNYLAEGGVFIFDVNSKYKYDSILASNDIILEYKDNYCLWKNYYDKKKQICTFNLSLFVKDPNTPEIYHKLSEEQTQKYYNIEFLTNILVENRFLDINMCYNFKTYMDDSKRKKQFKVERVCFSCRK